MTCRTAIAFAATLLCVAVVSVAAPIDPAIASVLARSYFEGREYFVLRSGRAEMIVQADRADIAPAFLYLLFDAENAAQSARKDRAYNYGGGEGFVASALEVVLGGFAFTAVGHATRTRLTDVDGIPAAEAVWWAGGVRVEERIFALAGKGAFVRRVTLRAENLGGPQDAVLRLRLPPGMCAVRDGLLVRESKGVTLALGIAGTTPARAVPERAALVVGPLHLEPGRELVAQTVVALDIAAGEARSPWRPAAPLEDVRAEPPEGAAPWVELSGPVPVQTMKGWARPEGRCTPVLADILVAFGEPLRFRVHVRAGATVRLVFGFCEGYHARKEERVLHVEVNGLPARRLDLVAEFGRNVPGAVLASAKDEDGDGAIDIAVAAAPNAGDKNPILNALWVFDGDAPPLPDVLAGAHDRTAAAFVHAGMPETWPAGVALRGGEIAAELAATRAAWARMASIETEDGTVGGIFAKARAGLPAMVADTGTMNAGIFEYGAQWVRDSSNTLLGLMHAGDFELARAGLEHLVRNMVREDGTTMIGGGFDDPDREQFDQMGELVHALRAYRDWTGDDSLVRTHAAKLRAMVERPLGPEFRDATGMVHNQREFWERTLDDAYELAYQTYLILGLREAAELAEPLGAADRAAFWRAEADRTLAAVLHHESRALIEEGRLIKRRGTDGEWVRTVRFPAAAADVPLATERVNLAEPDATMALPIAFGIVDPRSETARKTLAVLDGLWSARWPDGGYERYHSSGQCDQPGPWSFATCFILRAEHEVGLLERSRRSLAWLDTHCGGRTGAWFEEVPLVRSQAPTSGLLPWTSGEVALFVVRHLLGVRFEGARVVLKPALYPGSPPVRANLRFRAARLELAIDGAGRVTAAEVDGKALAVDADGAVRLPEGFAGGKVALKTR